MLAASCELRGKELGRYDFVTLHDQSTSTKSGYYLITSQIEERPVSYFYSPNPAMKVEDQLFSVEVDKEGHEVCVDKGYQRRIVEITVEKFVRGANNNRAHLEAHDYPWAVGTQVEVYFETLQTYFEGRIEMWVKAPKPSEQKPRAVIYFPVDGEVHLINVDKDEKSGSIRRLSGDNTDEPRSQEKKRKRTEDSLPASGNDPTLGHQTRMSGGCGGAGAGPSPDRTASKRTGNGHSCCPGPSPIPCGPDSATISGLHAIIERSQTQQRVWEDAKREAKESKITASELKQAFKREHARWDEAYKQVNEVEEGVFTTRNLLSRPATRTEAGQTALRELEERQAALTTEEQQLESTAEASAEAWREGEKAYCDAVEKAKAEASKYQTLRQEARKMFEDMLPEKVQMDDV